jgi:hypothetical protein
VIERSISIGLQYFPGLLNDFSSRPLLNVARLCNEKEHIVKVLQVSRFKQGGFLREFSGAISFEYNPEDIEPVR